MIIFFIFLVPSNIDCAKTEGLNVSPTNINTSVFLMSFKQFMNDQDDSIDEIEAVSRYNEYKRNISAQFIASYFEEHKSDQWFQEKYHPYFRDQIQIQKQVSFSQRFIAFWFLYERGLLDHVSLDIENVNSIENLIDISLILMDFTVISEQQINISEAHKKIVEKLNIFRSNDTIKPDTTTSLSIDDEEKKEAVLSDVQISLQDIILPERHDPFSIRFVNVCPYDFNLTHCVAMLAPKRRSWAGGATFLEKYIRSIGKGSTEPPHLLLPYQQGPATFFGLPTLLVGTRVSRKLLTLMI